MRLATRNTVAMSSQYFPLIYIWTWHYVKLRVVHRVDEGIEHEPFHFTRSLPWSHQSPYTAPLLWFWLHPNPQLFSTHSLEVFSSTAPWSRHPSVIAITLPLKRSNEDSPVPSTLMRTFTIWTTPPVSAFFSSPYIFQSVLSLTISFAVSPLTMLFSELEIYFHSPISRRCGCRNPQQIGPLNFSSFKHWLRFLLPSPSENNK